MPYEANADLPERVRHSLPPHAQSIYREAFNHAWQTYRGEPRHEDIAHRVAWAAVKKRCAKSEGRWVPRSGAIG
jgi:cation transport regulator